ncbi:hypothetical protein [Micromonospora sp. NPDC005710]|uniref:hypothetical protein n=1 Tax=Micromonospora sp. NPDC005710 TaxID=3157051 RepID=UPI0033C4FBE0
MAVIAADVTERDAQGYPSIGPMIITLGHDQHPVVGPRFDDLTGVQAPTTSWLMQRHRDLVPAWTNPALVLLSLLAVYCVGVAVWLAVLGRRATTGQVPARRYLDTFRSAVTGTVKISRSPGAEASARRISLADRRTRCAITRFWGCDG